MSNILKIGLISLAMILFAIPAYSDSINIPSNGQVIIVPKNVNGQFFVTGKIYGQEISFLVDTGAADIILSKKDALSIKGLQMTPSNRTIITGGGIINSYVTQADMWMGNTPFFSTIMYINPTDQPYSVLGMSMLLKFSLVYISHGELHLVP